MIKQQNDSVPDRNATVFALAVSAVTVLGLAYFTVASALDPGGLVPGGDSTAARVFAGYLVTRNVVLLAAVAAFAATRRWPALALVLALNAGVQVLDAGLGVMHQEVANIVGPAVIAALQVAAVLWLRRGTRPAIPHPA